MKGMVLAMKNLPLGNYHWEVYSARPACVGDSQSTIGRKTNRDAHSRHRTLRSADPRMMHNGAYNYRVTPHRTQRIWIRFRPQPLGQFQFAIRFAGRLVRRGDGARGAAPVLGGSSQALGNNGAVSHRRVVLRLRIYAIAVDDSAGLASPFVAHDYLEPAHFYRAAVGSRALSRPRLQKDLPGSKRGITPALALDHGGYNLYGLERVGLASGFKYFGSHDWFRELAKNIIGSQMRDGSWGMGAGMGGQYGPQIETPYNLLFLEVRAAGIRSCDEQAFAPTGHWANRPRDAANLARFASHELELATELAGGADRSANHRLDGQPDSLPRQREAGGDHR